MEEYLTPEQKKQLKTWAFQRDALLKNIADLREARKIDEEKNHNLAISNTDIQTQIHRAEGRLEELNKKEEEFKNILSNETSSLIIEKTKLQTEIPALKKEVESLHSEKDLLVSTIKTLT